MQLFAYTSDAAPVRRTWLPLVAWGTVFMAFGIVVAAFPDTFARLGVVLVGLLSLVAGLVLISWGFTLRGHMPVWWWLTIVPGVLLVVFAAVALLNPSAVASVLMRAAGVLVGLLGFSDMLGGWRISRIFKGWWVRLVRGLLVAVAGVWLALQPAGGIELAGILIGAWALIVGGMTVWLALWLRRIPKGAGPLVVESAPAQAEERTGLPAGDEPRPLT